MGTLSVDKLLRTSTGAAEFTLPATDGTAGQVMQTDGSGQLSLGNVTLATDSVTATQIAANAVTTTEIIDNAVTGAKIAMGSDATGDLLYYNGTDYVRLAAGTAAQVLTSAGVAAPTWSAAGGGGGGGFHQVVVKTSSDATYSPDTDVIKIIVHVQGGGGGTSNTGGSKGVSGGAAGGYAMKVLTVTSSYVINVTIGAGGNQGVGSEGVATDGAASSVVYVSGGTTFTSVIGNGGAKGNIASAAQPPTTGGTASGGDLNLDGNTGQGWMSNDNHQDGGNSPFGWGGRCVETGNPRSRKGTGYGSGASGANQGTGEGKDGQDGIVVIYEYK